MTPSPSAYVVFASSRFSDLVFLVGLTESRNAQEIKFGDNDTLSAITSSMVHADYLFLLTDVDGLYLSNPRKDPDATFLEVVSSVAEARLEGRKPTNSSHRHTVSLIRRSSTPVPPTTNFPPPSLFLLLFSFVAPQIEPNLTDSQTNTLFVGVFGCPPSWSGASR